MSGLELAKRALLPECNASSALNGQSVAVTRSRTPSSVECTIGLSASWSDERKGEVVLALAPVLAERPPGGRDERALYVEWPVSGVVIEAEFDPELVGQLCEVNPRYTEDLASPLQSGLTLAVGARRETTEEWAYLGFGVAGVVRG